MSAADSAIQKTIYVSRTTALIISNEEMDAIMKIAKLLEESGLLIEGTLFSIILGTLAASILANALTGRGVRRTGEGNIRASENF